jgi:polysaccharide export outer membrane protein
MHSMKTFLLFGVVSCLFCFASCATLKKTSSVNVPKDAVTAPDYLLGADDIVRVTVEQHSEWSGDFTLLTGGSLYIPGGIGEIKFDGLSKYGAEVVLTEALSKYINNPKVNIEIVRYASQVIYVLGEVNQPGRYATQGRAMTLRDAVVMAGLPSRFAALDRVYVTSPSQKRPNQQVVNLDRVLYRGELKKNITVYPGDIVFVPKTIWGYISDFVGVILSPLQTVPAVRQAATPVAVQ